MKLMLLKISGVAPHNLTMVPGEAVPTEAQPRRTTRNSYKTSMSGVTEYLGHLQAHLSLGRGGRDGEPLQRITLMVTPGIE